MDMDKDKKWMDMNQHNKLTKVNKSDEFFKKWYMTHNLDWMDGFNECLDLIVNCL